MEILKEITFARLCSGNKKSDKCIMLTVESTKEKKTFIKDIMQKRLWR